jgi:hypothetical protein
LWAEVALSYLSWTALVDGQTIPERSPVFSVIAPHPRSGLALDPIGVEVVRNKLDLPLQGTRIGPFHTIDPPQRAYPILGD